MTPHIWALRICTLHLNYWWMQNVTCTKRYCITENGKWHPKIDCFASHNHTNTQIVYVYFILHQLLQRLSGIMGCLECIDEFDSFCNFYHISYGAMCSFVACSHVYTLHVTYTYCLSLSVCVRVRILLSNISIDTK